ncbi:MAG TPA: hypothetical protein EYQ25_06970 [Planctomycetes bacterium]|nr:hypothetical protein [Planctomycetota bacterium]HIL36576.1 hypothetical protein [Planctomycetota bacterium]
MESKPDPRILWLCVTALAACNAGGSKQGNRSVTAGEQTQMQDGKQQAALNTPPDRSSPGLTPITSNAPTPLTQSGQIKLTPKPTTQQHRAQARLTKHLTSRVLPHLKVPASELYGVRLLASAPPAATPLDALLVQVLTTEGQLDSFVLLLDENDVLVARLPRAISDGLHALRIGALSIPLNAPLTWQGIASGEVDPTVAGAALRLGAILARDRLLEAAQNGWDTSQQNNNLAVLVLGVQPETISLPGEVPSDGPMGVPQKFRVEESMPPTLEGWSSEGNTWRGIARFQVIIDQGTALVLRVGLQGRLP